MATTVIPSLLTNLEDDRKVKMAGRSVAQRGGAWRSSEYWPSWLASPG